MDAHEIWCRDSDQGTSLGRSIPCPPALCSVRKIHLRPQVLRPTSPRNISLISNLDPTGNQTVQLTWQSLPEPLELRPKAL
ncbi:embryonic stem cell-related gene protein-like [Symphalangus syndactylus]|uniref:embryonic stem cell-related gene protein-like n=1 Tax=Symphalangus syndactylus TaxID=9590 RepID=UPI00300719E3